MQEHSHENHEHHHVQGHGSSCSCEACEKLDNIFEECEEEAQEDERKFRREMIFLAVTGVLFVLCLVTEEFVPALAGSYALNGAFIILYALCGFPVLKSAFKAVLRGDIFNEFTLMGGASLAAIAIGEMSESVGVMIFYRLGEALQERASSKSRRSIKALLAQKPMEAHVVRGDRTVDVDPIEIVKGDIVMVRPGELIPIDGIVKGGTSSVDCSAITGESVPVCAQEGSEVKGGTLALNGLLTIEAAGPFEDSTIARMLEMVQHAAARKAPTERFITRFAKWYTPAVFILAMLIMFVPPLTGHGEFRECIYRGLVMLVISCPCALVISIPLGYFGGIGSASAKGILVKGANVFDALGRVSVAVFDKTGTLTYGRFKVTDVIPADGVSKEELLSLASLAEAGSTHPIAGAIAAAADAAVLPAGAEVTQVPGKGMIYKNGDTVIEAGSAALMADCGITPAEAPDAGTLVYISKNGKYQGCIIASDAIRTETPQALAELGKLGIKETYMLTGDRETTAKKVAGSLGLTGYRAELLPQDKVSALQEICGGDMTKSIFIGDGVNDGPVLVTSETGIAMGGFGSQVAVEVSDAVILDDSLLKIAELMRVAKKTRVIVWENVVLALGIKGVFLIFGAVGLAGLWEAVFADVGVALLAILNAARTSRV